MDRFDSQKERGERRCELLRLTEERRGGQARSWSSKSSGKELKKSASMGREEEGGWRSSASTSIMPMPMPTAEAASDSISPVHVHFPTREEE
uniref:Uncharacterized protein n=1 Tax=Oryza punctata TaxID=4537 RepID=A0A0E0LY23_ORYPU